MTYSAIVNVPGYLPVADEPALFETAQGAWEYLRDERQRGEDFYEGDDYSETYYTLKKLAEGEDPGDDGERVNKEGIGTVYGNTPGNDSVHDLGLAYSVVQTEEEIEP